MAGAPRGNAAFTVVVTALVLLVRRADGPHRRLSRAPRGCTILAALLAAVPVGPLIALPTSGSTATSPSRAACSRAGCCGACSWPPPSRCCSQGVGGFAGGISDKRHARGRCPGHRGGQQGPVPAAAALVATGRARRRPRRHRLRRHGRHRLRVHREHPLPRRAVQRHRRHRPRRRRTRDRHLRACAACSARSRTRSSPRSPASASASRSSARKPLDAHRSPRSSGTCCAVLAHAVWNASTVFGSGELRAVYVLLMVPAVRRGGRPGRLVAPLRGPDADRRARRRRPARAAPGHRHRLGGRPDRPARSRAYAATPVARRAEEAMRDYQQAAIELGFLHTATCAAYRAAGLRRARPGLRRPDQRAPARASPSPDRWCPPDDTVPDRPARSASPRWRYADAAPTARMLTALVRLHEALQAVRLPLDLPGVDEQRTARDEMVDQLEDYVIPRVITLEAPLLAVVGGSTGAGKSTLVNSLVGARVTEPGVLRPDHPLAGARAPPRRRRVVRRRPAAARPRAGRTTRPTTPHALQLVAADVVPPGARHPRRPRRRLGRGEQPAAGGPAARRRRPLAVRHLGRAVRRPGAVGLPAPGRRALGRGRDRARPHAGGRGRDRRHPPGPDAGQPRAQGLAAVRRPRGPRSTSDGAAAAAHVAEIRGWLPSLGGDAEARAAMVQQTLDGRGPRRSTRRTYPVADAAAEQVDVADAAARGRRRGVRRGDRRRWSTATADGTLLRGEVLARWQEFVGTGELLKAPGEPRSAGSATGWSTRSRASRSRPSGSPWPSSPASRR